MSIQLFDRVLVDSAPRRVRQWGPYQFPSLCKKDGKYYYHFNDAADHYSAYGQPGWVYRSDAACHGWEWCENRDAYNEARALRLENGDLVCRHSGESALTKDLTLPEPAGDFTINSRHYTCYRSDDLPLEIGGFSLLRTCDEIDCDIIFAHLPPKTDEYLALYNRIIRAAGNEIINLGE